MKNQRLSTEYRSNEPLMVNWHHMPMKPRFKNLRGFAASRETSFVVEYLSIKPLMVNRPLM